MQVSIFDFQPKHKMALMKLLMLFLAYCPRELDCDENRKNNTTDSRNYRKSGQSELVTQIVGHSPEMTILPDGELFKAMDRQKIREIWRTLRGNGNLVQQIFRTWFIAAPALRQKVQHRSIE